MATAIAAQRAPLAPTYGYTGVVILPPQVETDAELAAWPTPRHESITTSDALRNCIDSLREADDPAIGVALSSDTDTRPGTFDRGRGTVKRIALSRPHDRTDGDAPSTFVLEHLETEALEYIRRWLSGSSGGRPPYLVLHDAHNDLAALAGLGLEPERFGSTLIASTLIAEGADGRHDRRSLGDCVGEELHHSLERGDMTTPHSVRLARAADSLIPLLRELTPRLRAMGLSRVYDLECRLLPAVIAMEATGIAVDAPRFQRIADEWVRERTEASDPERVTRLDKLISTYAHWPRDFVDLDGRIRCRLHPLAADSGRFSATQPNLQQVPGEHTAPGLRTCFVPAPGHRFVVADYAQIELRVAAHLAPCRALQEVFRSGRDPHRTTAATITGKPEKEITGRERKLAKAVNFGFLFGMGPARFRSYAAGSYGVELSDSEAQSAKRSFFSTYPGIAAWHERVGRLGHRDSEDVTVRTQLGRRKRFPAGKFSFNAALNIPVQGTAAEGFKLAMTELHRRLPEVGGRGVLCIHDEYLAEIPEEDAERGRDLVADVMRTAMASLVTSTPIEVEARIVDSWGHVTQ